LPLMRGTKQWRDAILLEGWPTDDQRYEAIRTSDYVHVETPNIPIPPGVDGHSLLPLMRRTKQWGAILLEGWPRDDQRYEAIRTSDYVYVETPGDKAELYDLKRDPLSDGQSRG
jgi:hypothetical protein